MQAILSMIKGFSRSRAVSVLGLIVVAIGALDPAIFEGHLYVRLTVMCIGAVAAAIGKALLHPSDDVFNTRFRSVALLILPLFSLILLTTGCPKKVTKDVAEKPDVRQEIVKKMRTAARVLDGVSIGLEEGANTFRDLAAAQAIEPGTAVTAIRHLLKANRFGQEGTTRFLYLQNIDEATRADLSTLIGEFSGALDSLLADGTIQIKNPKTQLFVFVGLRSSKVGLAFLQADLGTPFAEGVSIPIDEETKRILLGAQSRYERTTKSLGADLDKLYVKTPVVLPS